MKHLPYLIVVLSFSGLMSSCNEQPHSNTEVFNQTYEVGTIPGLRDFDRYTEQEKSLDSIWADYDRIMDSLYKSSNHQSPGAIAKKDFRHNRSRIFVKSYTNNKLDSGEFSRHESVSMPCDCVLVKDTIYVNMGIGFFGGLGFDIKLYGNKFQSGFFEYTDDVKPFKASLTDSAFTDFVAAGSKYQSLIVNEKPTFKSGQQLTGLLTFTTNNYYKAAIRNELDSTYLTGKLYFACKIR